MRADLANSSITLDTGRVSDGLDYVTAIVRIEDADANPIRGATVTFSSTASADFFTIEGTTTETGVTDAEGQISARVRGITAGDRTVTARVESSEVALSASTTLVAERTLPTFADASTWIPTPRSGLAAALGSDGRIYALGGLLASGEVTNVVEVLDPRALTWSSGSPMPTARSQLAAVATADGRLFAIGGLGGSPQPSDLPVLEALDIQTGAWSELAPMSVSRAGLAAVTDPLDQMLVALGGTPSPASAEVYYLSSPSGWTRPAALPTDRTSLAAVYGPDGSVYALGGELSGAPTDKVEVFNAALGTWSTGLPMLTPRAMFAAVAAPDGRIYAIGGTSCPAQTCAETGAVEAYDSKLDLWSPVGSLSIPRSGLSAVVAPSGNVLVIGGSAGSDPSSAQVVEIYGPRLSAQLEGDALTLQGTNFGADARVSIRLGADALAAVTTDSSGSFSLTQALPHSSLEGTGLVTAVDDRTQYPINALVAAP